MISRQKRIFERLTEALSPQHLEVENESHLHSVPVNSETHFKVLVVSAEFEGQSRIERQRRVNELLKEELRTGLHALTQRALTPQEWQRQKTHDFESPDCLGGSKKS